MLVPLTAPYCFFFALVLSIKCVMCLVSPVKIKGFDLKETHDKMVPVDSTDSILHQYMGD